MGPIDADDRLGELLDWRKEHEKGHRELEEKVVRHDGKFESGNSRFQNHEGQLAELKARTQPTPVQVVVLAVAGFVTTLAGAGFWLASSLDAKPSIEQVQRLSERVDTLQRMVDRMGGDKLDRGKP